jgi:membrane-associated phospholipid phosphatase
METVLFVRGSGSLENLMLFITNLGSENAYIVLLALYSWLVSPRMGRQLGLWFGLNLALNSGLKMLFNTPRPFTLAPGLASVKAMATAGGGAMPSGHAQNAAFISGFLADKHPKTWLITILVIITLLIAVSRVYLGVHFVQDVLIGLGIGLFLSVIASRLEIPVLNLVAKVIAVVVGLGIAFFAGTDIARSMGVAVAFLISSGHFDVPKTWVSRVLVAVVGLVLVFGLYFASSQIPESFKHLGWVSYLRYLLLALFAVEGFPRVTSRFVL